MLASFPSSGSDTIEAANSLPLHIPQMDVAFPPSMATLGHSGAVVNNGFVARPHHGQKRGSSASITGELHGERDSHVMTIAQQEQYVTADRRKTGESDIVVPELEQQHGLNNNRLHHDTIASTATTVTTTLGHGQDDPVEQASHAACMKAYFPSLTAMRTTVPGPGLLSTGSFPLPASNTSSLPSLFPAMSQQEQGDGDMYQYQYPYQNQYQGSGYGSGHYLVEDGATTSGGSASTTTNNYSGSAGSVNGGVCGSGVEGGGINMGMGMVDSAPFNQDVIESTFRMVGDLGAAGGVTEEC